MKGKGYNAKHQMKDSYKSSKSFTDTSGHDINKGWKSAGNVTESRLNKGSDMKYRARNTASKSMSY